MAEMRNPDKTKKISTPEFPTLKMACSARTGAPHPGVSIEVKQRWWKKTRRAARPRIPSNSRMCPRCRDGVVVLCSATCCTDDVIGRVYLVALWDRDIVCGPGSVQRPRITEAFARPTIRSD